MIELAVSGALLYSAKPDATRGHERESSSGDLRPVRAAAYALAGFVLPPRRTSPHTAREIVSPLTFPATEVAGAMTTRFRTPNLLDDLTRERDACGIGLVVDAKGRASRELLDRALAGLARRTALSLIHI